LGRGALRNPRNLAFALAFVALLLNIAAEHLLLSNNPAEGPLIPGLLDLRYAWNPCVSFSMFCQSTVTGSFVLVSILVALSLVVAVFAWRARHMLAAAGLGLILGGALGNLLDRCLYGAVLDFLALHLGKMQLFICNLSDIYVSAGVVLLLLQEAMPVLRRDRA
jgi:signal peptidase II